jgi:hypothetical protein
VQQVDNGAADFTGTKNKNFAIGGFASGHGDSFSGKGFRA